MPGLGAMHQLLSGQLRSNPTPTVSYLYDGGDFFPFVDSAFALAHEVWFPVVRMTGQPPIII